MTVKRYIHFKCWITMATNTHLEYIILIAFPRQHKLRERHSQLRYTYTAYLVPCILFVFS